MPEEQEQEEQEQEVEVAEEESLDGDIGESGDSVSTENVEDDSVVESEEKLVTGVQKRINALTAEKYSYKSTIDRLEAELREIREDKKKEPTKEPTLEDFDYDEAAFAEAKTKRLIQQHIPKAVAKIEKERIDRELSKAKAERSSKFSERVKKLDITDYAETITALSESVVLPVDVIEAIQDIENGPEVAYYLGKNIDKASKLSEMRPTRAALEVGKISASLESVSKQKKKITKAPTPITQIKNGGGGGGKSYEKMSMKEIMEL